MRPKATPSVRESEILHLLTIGIGPKRAADHLGISKKSVATHLERLRRKFRCKTTFELAYKVGLREAKGRKAVLL